MYVSKTTFAGIALVGLMAAGCATQPSGAIEAASALRSANATFASAAPRNEGAGLVSATNGDNWTAANLFERAERADSTPTNRFNLAAAYQRTGRLQQAASLYRTVAVDGTFTEGVTLPADDKRGEPIAKVNLAVESQRRLDVMAGASARQTMGRETAAELGVNASALVGGPKRGTVTDAHALRLDIAADAAGGE